jgi:hypothetical protein
MSSVAKTIAAIENMWQSAFPEIPWTKQALRVRVDPSFLSSKFQLIFDGNYQTLKIHAEVAGNLGGHARGQLPNPLFEATTPPDQSSLLLNLIQVKSSDLSFITFESGAEKFAFHNLVCLQHDDLTGQWVVIYNSLDRQKELILAIKKILQACQDPVREDLYAFFQLLIKRDFNGALRAIEGSKRLSPLKSQLQWATALYGYQLNAHGLKRTFKFWSTEEKSDYLQSGMRMIDGLRQASTDVSLGFGAVLGFHRDQDLIAHDDDIDIIIAFNIMSISSLGAALEVVEQQLLADGFEVAGRFFSHLWVRTEHGRMVDVFVGLVEEGGVMSFYPSSRATLHVSDVFPTNAGEMYSIKLPMHANIEGYLQKTYGMDWRQPDIGFSHAWNREEYKDIAGARKHPMMQTRGEMAFQARHVAKIQAPSVQMCAPTKSARQAPP